MAEARRCRWGMGDVPVRGRPLSSASRCDSSHTVIRHFCRIRSGTGIPPVSELGGRMDARWRTRAFPRGQLAVVRAGETEAASSSATAAFSLRRRFPEDEFFLYTVSGIADLEQDGSPEAAAYELLRLDDALWQYGFLAYLRHRHQAGLAGEGSLAGARLAAHLAVARDARVLRRTKAVMEAAHRGRTLSLAELARAGDRPVEDRRKREVGLRERVLWPMDELGIWDVSEVPRACQSSAAHSVIRYEIGAGSALIAFDALHYRPWLLRQLEHLDTILGQGRHPG